MRTSSPSTRNNIKSNDNDFLEEFRLQASTYSYTPKELLKSFQLLKTKEVELLSRAASEAPMESSLSNDVVRVAATQLTGSGFPDSDVSGFCFRAEHAIEVAVAEGANIILLPELWSGPYFCQSQVPDLMLLADESESHVLIKRMQLLAKLYAVVLPVSIFERSNNVLYNSLVMIDVDGTVLGTYRKSHIPDGTGYQEKFYFSPGDTGFKVFETKICKIGVGICWDQWFPEQARCLALNGADVILYPTAIGTEPQNPNIDSSGHWQRTIQGHSAANMIPVVVSNRYGMEILLRDDGSEQQRIHFYGKSFITDNTGSIVAECDDNQDEPVRVVTAVIDVEKNARERLAWGIFRDRRTDLYDAILTKNGRQR